MEEEIFKPDTIVRIKHSGEFGRINKRCACGGLKTKLHYEVWIQDRQQEEGVLRIMVLFHEDLELECLPLEPDPVATTAANGN